MTAVAVQRRLDQQHSHEHNQNISAPPPHRRQQPNHCRTTSGPSQPYTPTATPPKPLRPHNQPPLDGVEQPPSRSKELRHSRSANGASATNTPEIMPAQTADAAAGRSTNGAPQRRIDTIIGGNMNAGRRNQSSATLSSKDGAANGKTNGKPPVSRTGAPLLQRSKSDYGPRGEEAEETEEDGQDWGARHGFDGHYASDEFVSQLVHVSCSFHNLF